nr:MAG TPA: hypothetical protein [Bacteriophage sp.]
MIRLKRSLFRLKKNFLNQIEIILKHATTLRKFIRKLFSRYGLKRYRSFII